MANVHKKHVFVATSLILIISFSSITGEIKKIIQALEIISGFIQVM